ncbi:hypothetical protein BX666DRAFT_1879363 [Dichotomocladium elegans]|nr:hypothetical protein BX666DRAFT_1879363 [Dichotomocladium elegans]
MAAQQQDDEDLIRLLELQRQEYQRFYESGEIFDIEREEHHHERHARAMKRPQVPDMRFEQQFNKSIATMKANGATTLEILCREVIVGQFVMPFINGFTWCLASHMWQWWRVRSRLPRRLAPDNHASSPSYFRGLKYGISRWLKNAYASLVHLPALTAEPAAAAAAAPTPQPQLV